MSKYYFLPYLRQGLAGIIKTPDALSSSVLERANIDIQVPVKRKAVGGTTETVDNINKQIKLKGPGDIIGINSNQVIKVSPQNWITNMEPNYLPYIEFYDEDFPWRYTPAAAVDDAPNQKFKLRPWIALVVLEENEFETLTFNGILPRISIQEPGGNIFPTNSQMWAWAHVHVNNNLEEAGTGLGNARDKMKSTIDSEPDKALSRIICPRRLKANTNYHAFLIPTFETGRLAGIGETANIATTDSMAPSWTSATPVGTVYPVYYQWFFKTGNAGDFESLVRLLKPRSIPATVGKRSVDLQLPGDADIDLQSPVSTIGLQGVLTPPTAVPDTWTEGNFTNAIKGILNRPYTLKTSGWAGPDPIIAPPTYGQWHANVDHLSGTLNANWINSANMDPRLRIFAGAGTEVVRRNQDKYMQIAWQQVGEIIEANRKLRHFQIALEASAIMFDKHITPLSDESVLAVSNPVHAKVIGTPGTVSVYKEIGDSAIPNSMLSGAFRRVTRPGGPLMRSMALTGSPTSMEVMVSDINSGSLSLTSPYTSPAAMMAYSIWPASSLTASFTLSLPSVSSFTLTAPASVYTPPVYGPPSPAATSFVAAVAALHSTFSLLPSYTFSSNPSLNIATVVTAIETQSDPNVAIKAWAVNQVQLFHAVTEAPTASLPDLYPVMVAPQIVIPAYKELAALSTDWIMPGLNTIEQNSINTLKMSQANIEAFMLGLNHEMSRELLWRGYPTDQRGTYFSFFWGYDSSLSSIDAGSNLDNFKDIWPIHQWRPGHSTTGALAALGVNTHRGIRNPTLLILTIRGELLLKYPGTLIYMQPATYQTSPTSPFGPLLNSNRVPTGSPLLPVFSAKLEPDIYFIAFDIDVAVARGIDNDAAHPGYFFVFQERAGELRFGADQETSGTSYTTTVSGSSWNDLNWGNIVANGNANFINADGNISVSSSINWGRNAANMAHILMQLPVKLNVHAKELIP